MARNVADAAFLMGALMGREPMDPIYREQSPASVKDTHPDNNLSRVRVAFTAHLTERSPSPTTFANVFGRSPTKWHILLRERIGIILNVVMSIRRLRPCEPLALATLLGTIFVSIATWPPPCSLRIWKPRSH